MIFHDVTTVYGMAGGEKRTMKAAFTVCGNANTVEEVRCLIAAAPELLVAAQLVLKQFIQANPPCLIPAMDRLATVIAHATGKE
jgi:hypothetical protein